ncbi:cytochrome aa3 quinol oxidase subunit II [Halobacillus sp. ACCC02827]|uniref:cytochrome aa3 quinol oxidase subunit II n=1 Tax=Bacillaceae TaxID=186817 RepID=UPI0002A50176|nr:MULTISPECIES: cytochrome aa3 quinol oxidase subunit II [Bacillaceae]ELK46027.1 cytochrome aa3 quinol oxidase subunit II [Halobacillus sp. BAB-2008]QHT46252.1 cytochrome aa3 quinol oxidase subunit II [Bacillus sp. SB49]WJE17072.1 cytochrome aa3 quinol oxidase subunit II [Halobacillus sp. ACCC02827]
MKAKHLRSRWLGLLPLSLVLFLSGCGQMTVLNPKGPVAESQKDLIVYSLWFMLGIVVVVFALFAYMVIKYRDRPGRGDKDYAPNLHGNTAIEVVWTVIPIIIVTLLSIPTVTTLFDLEKPPEPAAGEEAKEPLVVYATAADWKWFFSYPEQDIETVNYLHIPTDRPIEFRLTSADSMSALWIPALGGQKYNMAGMMTKLYLQADEEGVYDGRNSNFNGEGFAAQTFKVHAESEENFNSWVSDIQNESPELTQDQYNDLVKPGLTDKSSYSSTHLEFVDHGTHEGASYVVDRYFDLYGEKLHLGNDEVETQETFD